MLLGAAVEGHGVDLEVVFLEDALLDANVLDREIEIDRGWLADPQMIGGLCRHRPKHDRYEQRHRAVAHGLTSHLTILPERHAYCWLPIIMITAHSGKRLGAMFVPL